MDKIALNAFTKMLLGAGGLLGAGYLGSRYASAAPRPVQGDFLDELVDEQPAIGGYEGLDWGDYQPSAADAEMLQRFNPMTGQVNPEEYIPSAADIEMLQNFNPMTGQVTAPALAPAPHIGPVTMQDVRDYAAGKDGITYQQFVDYPDS